ASTLLLHVLREAVRLHVSDIHFLREGAGEVRIKFRIDGILQSLPQIDRAFENMRAEHGKTEEDDLGERLIAHTMWLAGMDVADRTRPHDGSFSRELRPGDPSSVVLARAAAIPSVRGYTMAIRLLPQENDLRPLEEQGFSTRDLAALHRVAQKKQGLFLVTGPTGSGKSTTIAAIVDVIRRRGGLNIFTIEEPVEYRFSSGVTQIDLTRTPGVGFDGALRTALRMDPDVIVVGEIRDRETAKIASQAANTGHLVLSTLHTNNATVAINRLQELGVEPHLLVDNLLGVLAQRLVPTLCPHCSLDAGPPNELHIKTLGYAHLLELPEYQGARVRRRGPGCRHCNHTGYRGRVAIHELFLLTPSVRRAIAERASDERIRELAVREGMTTLREATLRRYLEGLVDLEAVVQIEMDVEDHDPSNDQEAHG
ncbi:GspE/PulE family protein, partial [Oceanithermus sp.]|uniref:GspE/PulE family protein n=1 Tax=Oceanithermus sp. TaxID=2268145 RepID=UPI0025804742